MLIEQIKADRVIAMKEKNEKVKSVLSVLVGEIDRNRGTKELTDELAVQAVIKMCKACEETIAMLPEGSDVSDQKAELAILSKYKPSVMDAKKLRDIILDYIANENANKVTVQFGSVMKELKKYGNQVDMKMASVITKELIG